MLQAQAPAKDSGSGAGERPAHQRWQGREVAFMRGNEHSSERRGVWNPDGLEGAARALVDGDRDAARHGRRSACAWELSESGRRQYRLACAQTDQVKAYVCMTVLP